MPELPEVEIIRRGLEQGLVGRRITDVECAPDRLRKHGPCAWTEMAGATVTRIDRHAKVMRWHFDSGHQASVHLGMTGKFLFESEPRPHTHITWHLDDGATLHFSDHRRFGWFALHPPDQPPRDTDHYGVDALDPAWSPEMLEALLRGSRAPLKAFLLDQAKIAGLGNIYACEALWRSCLSPRRKACNTPSNKIAPLLQACQAVLQDSLAAGGTSFNDYVDSIGQQGSFLFDVGVFQREGDACPRCGDAIKRIVQSGRSTFFCSTCQR